MDEYFHDFFKNVEDSFETAKFLSKCGKCKHLMKCVEKAGKIKCEHCNLELTVPSEGKYRILGEKLCPLDNF